MTGLVLAAPDKFRGTAGAAEIAEAIAAGAAPAGWRIDRALMSDGGEGLLECVGGPNRVADVTGPLGRPVRAGWRLDGERAVIESAAASGLALAGPRPDPLGATSAGTGELILSAIEAGATDIVVGVGGSAMTDGGAAAVDILAGHAPLDGSHGARVTVAADVTSPFADAAWVFAPQKGADDTQVRELADRLTRVAASYRERFGVDVTAVPGAGAAGGLAGGLAALGARIRPGAEVVAEWIGLSGRLHGADVVVTGEGRLDRTTRLGKVPFYVAGLAAAAGIPCLVIAGEIADEIDGAAGGGRATGRAWSTTTFVSLTERFGGAAARGDVRRCVERAVAEHLSQLVRDRPAN